MQKKWIMVNNNGTPKTSRFIVALMNLSVLLLLTSLACAQTKGYKEDFDTDAGGWGGDGASYEPTEGNPASGGYHEASRMTYSPYHQPIDGRAAEFLKGDLIENFGERFKVSMDVKRIAGGNFGFIAYIYGKDGAGEQTIWQRTILQPGKVPAKWTNISFEVNAADESVWTRAAGSMSLEDTLRNVNEFPLFGGSGKTSQETITGIDNFEVTPLEVEKAPEPEAFDSWAVERPYRVLIDVQKPTKPFPKHMPFRKSIRFGKLLKDAGVEDSFAPGSVVVTCYDPASGKETVIQHLLDESFVAKDYGNVSWDLANNKQSRFAVYFDTESETRINSGYVPMIGVGDNISYNRGDSPSPISTHGIRPTTGDVDGDGLIDVISPSIYTSTWGQPQFTCWFWKNIGTNEKPVFANFVRLYDSLGNAILNNYNNCELYDWDNDGLLDLITSDRVYLNTGEINKAGMPVFENAGAMVSQAGNPTFIGMRDHDLDGVYDAFYYKYGVHYAYEGNPSRNFLHSRVMIARNSAGAGQPPKLSAAETIELGGETNCENVMVSDFYDFDGDGAVDCVGALVPLDEIPSIPKIVYWPNTAGAGEAPVYGEKKIVPNSENFGYSGIISVDNEAFKGLLIAEGHKVRYWERTGEESSAGMPYHKDGVLLKQIEGRCVVDGYNGIDVEDWEGDGDWDLISGSEFGHVWLLENTGDNERPVFEAPVIIEADGKPMRVMRWHYIEDGNPEYYLGQSKPRYVDFDGDGDNDLIVGNNTNRLVLFKNKGTREAPVFAAAELIKVGSDEAPFAYRNQPAVIDWNGDGQMDVLTRNKAGYLGLFYGKKSGDDNVLRSPKLLRYTTGGKLSHPKKEHGVGQWDVCDWDGDGDYDLIGQAGGWGKAGPYLYENVGSNRRPKFKREVPLKSFGTQITLSSHEHSFAVVDWYKQGKYDLVCGGESGLFFFFRNPSLVNSSLPKAAISSTLQSKK